MRTPPASCAIKFSWSQSACGGLQPKTISSADSAIVGDVKEVADLVEEHLLTLFARDVLADDDQPRVVDRIVQVTQRGLVEPPTEISRRRRIGNRVRTDRIQKDFVVAPQFDVLQTPPVAPDVDREVEHMIRLVIRHVHF